MTIIHHVFVCSYMLRSMYIFNKLPFQMSACAYLTFLPNSIIIDMEKVKKKVK